MNEIKLSEVATIIMGQSPKSDTYNTEGIGMPLLNGPTEFGLIHPECTLFTTNSKRNCKKGDLIFCVRGSTTGRMNWADRPYSLGRGVCSIRGKSSIETKYIKYCIEYTLPKLLQLAGGATFPNLTSGDLATFSIPYSDNRFKIAAILSAYDDLIENNTRRIKILEEMAQLIYKEWFVKFRFPGHEKVRMVESELGPIPEGWDVRKLSDLVDTQYGYTESAKELPVGPKYLRGTDINKNSYIDWDKVPFCPITDEDYKKYKLNQGDILVIRMADPGKVGIVEQSVEAVFASYLIRLKIKSLSVTPYYLFYFMLSDRFQNYINGASTGTTRKSASASVITDISLVIPPKEIIDMFEEIIVGYRKFLNILLKQNNILRRTRDLLLPKLISGELDVEDLDIAVGSD